MGCLCFSSVVSRLTGSAGSLSFLSCVGWQAYNRGGPVLMLVGMLGLFMFLSCGFKPCRQCCHTQPPILHGGNAWVVYVLVSVVSSLTANAAMATVKASNNQE